ncbi:heavy metal translocating P-type ATPase [bacterium]|nr:heavy metal translocating P-type ATPase [bacterium]
MNDSPAAATSADPRAADRDAPADIPCTHCGLPVPPGLIDPNREEQFCCHGCETVYGVIHGHGLERFYDLAEQENAQGVQAKTTDKSYEEFDDPAFEKLYVRALPDGSRQVELYLEGVHCAACVWLVEKVPIVVPGAIETRLDFGRSAAIVRWDPNQTSLAKVARFLDSLGYAAHPWRGVQVRDMRRAEDRKLLIRIAVAGAAAMNVMVIAFALYGGMFGGMEPQFRTLFRYLSMAISIPAVLWAGWPFYRGAIGALRTRALHMDLPVAIGLTAGLVSGSINTLRGVGEIYFDSVTILVFLLLCGRWVQNRRQRSAADAAELLYSLAPSSARCLRDGQWREVPVESIESGDVVEVRAGDSIPADGLVDEGESELDLSLLTGESVGVSVKPGDRVHAGTVNLSSRLIVRVEGTGENTRVGRLLKLVEDYARRKAPIVRLADRISAYFVAIVLVLAAATFVVWRILDPAQAVDNALALLIVTCPCALGLATPLAVSVAIGRAANRGILIKGGDVLEILARSGHMILDKTGTVTEGRVALVRWVEDGATGNGVTTLRRRVAALEAHSSHPVATALAKLGDNERHTPAVSHVRQLLGAGIEGVVDGQRLRVGTASYVLGDESEKLPPWAADAVDAATGDALTPILVTVDGRVAAVAAMGDPIRDEARATIERLRALRWDVELLSGDHPAIVAAVAKQLGLDADSFTGAAKPEDKLARVQALSGGGPVVMVGDGVNDAAALSAASVGIGVHGGAEASLAAADVFMTRPGLEPIVELVVNARRTLRVIRRNLIFSLCYNLVGATLAMTGLLNPLIAALLMPASSITVITSSFRHGAFHGNE